MECSLSDEDLVQGTLGGEKDAFSQLYDRYRQPVFATVYRIIQSSEEAQDATQEIFIKVYRTLCTYDSNKARFSTWLYRIATNHAIDCRRVHRRRLESQSADNEESASHDAHWVESIRSPLHKLEGREEVDEVRRCVDKLPDLQKKVFILRYFQELKLVEIAKMEECSLGTIKTSLFRATRTVRRGLERFRGYD